jgi:hypothetical protein
MTQMSAHGSRLLLPLFVLAATLVPLPTQALGLPETLAAGVDIGNLAGISTPRSAAFPIDFLGVSWAGGEVPSVRFRSSSAWGPWLHLEEEEVTRGDRTFGRLVPGGDARTFQIRGVAEGLRASVFNTTDGPRTTMWGESSALASHVLQGPVVPRSGWGADESLRFSNWTEKSPQVFYPLQKLIIHHTATGDGAADPAAAIRAIYAYHANEQGLGDIAYHFVIDRNGIVYKGRYSGPVGTTTADTITGENETGYTVRGAHTGGANSGTVGIAILGTHTNTPISPATRAALTRLLAWESDHHGLDPRATTTYTNPVDASTRIVPNISGHRDWSPTACPGDTLYADLPAIREETVSLLGDTSPPAPGIVEGDAALAFQRQRAFQVSWSAVDDHAATAFDVTVRTGRRGSYGPVAPWLLDTPVMSATFVGTPGETYCFSAAASDPVGNQGPPGPEACTAVPLDERRLKRAGDWSHRKVPNAYLGTLLETTEQGAILSGRFKASRLAVVVTKCRACGVLDVIFGGKRLKRIRLWSSRMRRRQIVEVKTFAHIRTGRLLLRVRSDGRPVPVEGVGISLASATN